MKSIFYASLFAVVLSSALANDYLEVEKPSNRTYFVATEICCNGTIYENKNSAEYECCCCGGKLIEKKTEICCFPESYPRGPNVECCGNKSYNTETHACHLATHTRTSISSSNDGQFVIFPVDVNESTTCGDKIMNLEKEICCSFQILPDPDQKLLCCGNQTFDYNTEVCCPWVNTEATKIIPMNDPNDADCCGEKSYNSITQFCSKGDVIVDMPKGDFSTCIDTIYDRSKEVCCEDFTPVKVLTKLVPNHDACCGDVSYNNNDSVCCTNWNQQGDYVEILHSRVENQYCCGSEMVDENQECCDDEKPYDPKTQTCCSSWDPSENVMNIKVFEGPNGMCCGSKVLDLAKEECCGITVIPKSPDGKSGCCMHTVNDIEFYHSQRWSGRNRFFSDNL